MHAFLGIIGFFLLALFLWDAFETIVLPRRVTRQLRLTRIFYRATWLPWSALAKFFSYKRRESYLSFYGPLSLLALIVVWAVGLIFSFALLQWATGSGYYERGVNPSFILDLYVSATTFTTLGLVDVSPGTPAAKVLIVFEGGMGFGFLALVIGYFPVLYQSFSRREVNISLLDARAGSPPSAAELLLRHSHEHGMEALRELLRDWERWSAELLESHLSYPVLSFFRSQHDNESWLGALTTILDTSALVMTGIDGACERQAELTFAMARHAVVDLAQMFSSPSNALETERLSQQELKDLRSTLNERGLRLRDDVNADRKLIELRQMYEPYVSLMAEYLCISLPPWIRAKPKKDNWQTSAWSGSATTPSAPVVEDHF